MIEVHYLLHADLQLHAAGAPTMVEHGHAPGASPGRLSPRGGGGVRRAGLRRGGGAFGQRARPGRRDGVLEQSVQGRSLGTRGGGGFRGVEGSKMNV